MTVPRNAVPNNTTQVEPKVKWQAALHYLVGLAALAVWDGMTLNDNAFLADVLPDAVEIFVLPLVPTVGGLIAGYFTRHQWRHAEVQGNL